MPQASSLKPVLLGLGSNVNMQQNMLHALYKLEEVCRIYHLTSFYKNEAVGIHVAPEYRYYVNAVVFTTTELSLADLLESIKATELEIGRQRNTQACAIDIDILAYSDFVGLCGLHQLPRLADTDPYYWRCLSDEYFCQKDFIWEKMEWACMTGWQSAKTQSMKDYLQSIQKLSHRNSYKF